MKTIILLSATLLLMLFANAQIVNIPDANFKAALVGNSAINTNIDTEIQVSEAYSYTGQLYVSNLNIIDLTGIEAFTAIFYLSCSGNQLSSIDVSNNTALTNIDCSSNDLTSLDVSNNTALEYLHCSENQISSLDLSNNTAILELYCNYNQLNTLNVYNCIEITRIWCCTNQLSTLDVSNNFVLDWLACHENLLTTLDVSNNTFLELLTCRDNQLSSLDVSNNPVLLNLGCERNQLSTLDVSNNPDLYYFYCGENQLSSLNLMNGNNTYIGYIMADTNPNLYCIEVDDSTWSTANWTDTTFYQFDSIASFSNNCTTNTYDKLKTQELKLAPNPFNEKLSVLLPENTNADNIEIVLYNVLGKQIKVSTEKANNEIIINGANLHSGIYFVEIREQNKVIGNAKLIKQ